jgi:hypothetical protein
MPNYQLNIVFDTDDLQTIKAAEEKVTLMKKTNKGKPLAWVAFLPFQNNTVAWEEDYALYASKVTTQSGATIYKLSDVDASPMVSYPFQDYGAFGIPVQDSSIKKGQYKVVNNYQDEAFLTFGLAQGVQVNGTAFPNRPINASIVPREHDATFIPLTEVVIFLDSQVTSGMVITEVSSPQTPLIFGGDVTEITVKYDSNSGLFIQQQPQ